MLNAHHPSLSMEPAEPARKRRNREHTNSRNGCTQCKARKVKCDEDKPKCRACVRRGTDCTFTNDVFIQLASAAGAPSSPAQVLERSFSFTPIQSEFGASSPRNNGAKPMTFAPYQHNFGNRAPGNDQVRANSAYQSTSSLAATPGNDQIQANRPLQPTPTLAATSFSVTNPSPFTLNLDHLELLHHFIAVTSHDISIGPIGHSVWYTIVPKLALSHDWLMHSVLAVSALHIAHLRPDHRIAYWKRAALHQDQALQGQQRALANPSRENGDALFAFTFVIVYLAFASPRTSDSAEGAPLQGVLRCLHMLRGIRAILPAIWEFVQDGPLHHLRNLHPGNIKSSPYFQDAITEARFSKLLIFASTNAEMTHDQDIDDVEIFAAAASSLRASFLKIEGIEEGESPTSAIWTWAVRLPVLFATRVDERHVVPLVLIAHWCVLLNQVQHYWWIHGWVDQTMREIEGCLPQGQRHWLEWPLEKVHETRAK